MLSLMAKTPDRLVAPQNADTTCDLKVDHLDNVLFIGMGGSGIAGDILTDCARDVASVPLGILRGLRLPAYVGKRTLCIAISYSGETHETNTLLEQATKREAKIGVISSGGRLLAKAQQTGFPYLRIPSGMPPRVALPELIAASVFMLSHASVFEDAARMLSEARSAVADRIETIKPQTSLEKNSAKQLAQVLVDRLPLIIGVEEDGSVLRRFKNELNENSKMPAFYYVVPEAFHDDVEGLKALKTLANVQTVFLRNENWLAAQGGAQQRLADLLEELGFSRAVEFGGQGQGRLSQLLTSVVFADYVSVYLAALRGVDPSELNVIPGFRKVMRS